MNFGLKSKINVGIKYLNDLNTFIECSNTRNKFYENIDDYNLSRKRKTLVVFDNMIADIKSNKKFQAIMGELFVRCRKIKYFTCFYHFCSKTCEIKFNTLFDYEN